MSIAFTIYTVLLFGVMIYGLANQSKRIRTEHIDTHEITTFEDGSIRLGDTWADKETWLKIISYIQPQLNNIDMDDNHA